MAEVQTHQNPGDFLSVDAEGFDIFPNLKSESKKGLYFKLVMLDMNFEQASNHCVSVSSYDRPLKPAASGQEYIPLNQQSEAHD